MNHFEKDEISIISQTSPQQSNEPVNSEFRRNISRTQSSSISISMASLDPYERQPNLVGHTHPLRTVKKNPFVRMSGPLYATSAGGNNFQNSIVMAAKKVGENKKEKFEGADGNRWNNDYGLNYQYLMKSGQLGMCNEPFCSTCPTYFNLSQQTKPRASTVFDSEFYNCPYGDAKSFGRKLSSLFSSCIPGVMNPHAKVVQQWNKLLAIFCSFSIFVDPLFIFLFYVKKDDKCMTINWTMATTLIALRSITDVLCFLNILLLFRLAYIRKKWGVVGAGDLIDHPKDIALNYLRGLFFIDLLVVLPFAQVMILIAIPNSLGTSGENYTKNLLLLVFFVQYIIKLFRFLPMIHPNHIIESPWANCIMSLLTFMLSGHVVGSCWYFFGLQRVNRCLRDACYRSDVLGCMDLIVCDSKVGDISATLWSEDKGAHACLNSTYGSFSYGIYTNAIPLITETNLINKYMYALFWGCQQISTLAGNQTPSYFGWEVLFTMSIILLGLFLLALLIGNIQYFFQSAAQRSHKMLSRFRDVEQWMSHRRLPEELKRIVRRAERYRWAATRGVLDKTILENFPEDIQIEIRRHLFQFVKKVQIFSEMYEDEPILDAIRERLIHTMYIRGSIVLSKGDLVQKMVFILHGTLESIGEDGIPVRLSEGDIYGEELLRWNLEQYCESKGGKEIKRQGEGLTSYRTVICLTNVEAFLLHPKDIEEVLTLFETFSRSRRVQAIIRYESPYWRSLAANRIQVAWRYRKKRLNRANSNTTQ